MATTDDLTTLVCLFHHQDQAHAAVIDLLDKGIPQSAISLIGGDASASEALQSLGIPDRDFDHLLDSVQSGGVLVAVSAAAGEVRTVEGVFGKHSAKLIDEADGDDATGVEAGAVIPIVEEELAVGKRTVDQGGVRVYRRVIEIPVDQEVTLHQEHVNVERRAVDRPVTDADLTMQGDRTIELVETAEEVVVGKSARVVEEVVVGKSASERTEHIHDTVRRTEVTVEDVAADDSSRSRP